MVTLQIGADLRAGADITESWIHQQLGARRDAVGMVCVQVLIQTDGYNLRLSTSDCPRTGGAGWEPNDAQRRIVELWKRHHLDHPGFTGGQLTAFVQQVRSTT